MGLYYVSEPGGVIRATGDVLEWARWMEADNVPGFIPFEDGGRRVARTDLPGGGYVSTVFLGLDHSHGGPVPLLFETMAFDIPNAVQRRYATVEDARAGHAEVVAELTESRGTGGT